MDAKFSSHNIMLSHSSTAKHEYIIKSEFRAGEVGDKLVEVLRSASQEKLPEGLDVHHPHQVLKGENLQLFSHLLSGESVWVGAKRSSDTTVIADSHFFQVCGISASINLDSKHKLAEQQAVREHQSVL